MKQEHTLGQVLEKKVHKIYLVDFEDSPAEDIYSPWQILIFFDDFDYFLDVEDAYDGDHINISLRPCVTAESVLRELTVPGLWNPSQVEPTDSIGQLIGLKITQLLYAIDKASYSINGMQCAGNQGLFRSIKVVFDVKTITIFSNGVGLFTGIDTSLVPDFEDTYNWIEVIH
jgi:hypothetical protein